MTTPVPGPATTPAPAARRELTVAVGLAALAGGLALSSGGQAWADVTVTREAPLPPVDLVLTGSQLAPLVPATGLLLLASAVALIAVRGWGRVVVGAAAVLAGGTLVVSGVQALAGGVATTPADLGGSVVGLGQATVRATGTVGWPVLAVLAGVLGAAGGLLVVLRGRSWPGLGRRYERTPGGAAPAGRRAARPESAEDRHQAAWKAMDSGSDPTDGPTEPGTTGAAR